MGRWSRGGLVISSGSSERDTLRDEPMPEMEDDRELRDVLGVEEAREASSRESRGKWLDGALRLA